MRYNRSRNNKSYLPGLLIIIFFINDSLSQNVLSDSLVKLRLQTIKEILEDGKTNENRWWYGWIAVYGSATIAQGTVLIINNNKNTRQDMALGATTTLLGTFGQLISPMKSVDGLKKLSQLTESNPEERYIKLVKAEMILEETALKEEFGRSWKSHAICGLVNLSGGLITWLGFDRTLWEGLGNFALNTAITEIQIFTCPNRILKNYYKYCTSYLIENPSKKKYSLCAGIEGVSFKILF